MSFTLESYEVVVVGAGHAGCEAALACARMGHRTLLLTLNMDGVALMPCNPSIGGTAKGHLVREIDALGGEMGRAIDDTFLQSRMLNTGKGPAVHSLRAQADKKQYQRRMLHALQHQERLTLRQGEVEAIETAGGRVSGVRTTTGALYPCAAAIVATGVYLKSRVIVGEAHADSGPSGLGNAKALSGALERLGFPLRRFKTGTPARIDCRTVDFSKFEEQPGDERIVPFSFLTDRLEKEQISCYLGYTTPETHRIIRENLHRAPLFSGEIHGVGPRYCPSIEDKVVRFADRERHPLFLEPEGLDTLEWYVQGMSTSLPEDVQWEMYRSIPGLGGDFTNKAVSGGGVLIDWGVHYLDIVMYCCGDPAIKTVSGETFCKLGKNMKEYVFTDMWAARKPKYDGVYDVDDSVTGLIRTSGPVITLNGAWAQNIGEEERYIDFMGDKGGIRLQYGSDFTVYTTENNGLISFTPKFQTREMFQNEIDGFINCIKTGEKLPSHIDTVIVTAKMMQAIYDSAEQHREIVLE